MLNSAAGMIVAAKSEIARRFALMALTSMILESVGQ